MNFPKAIIPLLLALCAAVVAHGKTTELTISGGEKINAEFQRGMPVPAAKSGVRIQAAAFVLGGGSLTYTFGLTSEKAVKKVVVEDVTGAKAVRLVEDNAPVLADGYWNGDSSPLAISKTTLPWLYERGDTTKVFRFTVTLADKTEPVVLHQPAVYAGGIKDQLLQKFAPGTKS